MFASGVVMTSVGGLAFITGIGILTWSSDHGYLGAPTEDRSAQRTVGAALAIAGPAVAVPGLLMAVMGGQREGPTSVALTAASAKHARRRDPTLFGTGLTMAIVGGLAMTTGAVLLLGTSAAESGTSRGSEQAQWRSIGSSLAIGGGLVLGSGLAMAIVGGKRVHDNDVAIVPVVDSKSAGAVAVVRF